MTHSAQFTATVRAIQNVLPNTDIYTTLQLADEIHRVHSMPVTDHDAPTFDSHESRVQAALGSDAVLNHLHYGKKVYAIKELRLITGAGLLEAKQAVEDARVMYHYGRV